jgi:hypothetical protein
MFRFLTPKPGENSHPLQTAKTAAAWFRQLPSTDAIGRQLHVIRALEELCQSGDPLQSDHVAAVACVDAELGADRGQLLAQYVDSVNSSAAVAARLWQAVYDISAAFIVAYGKLLDAALANPADARWRRETPWLMARLIHYFGTDAKLRALRSERWIPAKWGELHGLYRRAIELGIERAEITADHSGASTTARTIEREYVSVLLTQLVNTGTLAPSQLEWTLAQVRGWSRALALETVAGASSSFAVDLGGRKGLVRRFGDETGGMLRYLDTRPLAAEIERAIAALRPAAAADAESAGSLNRQRIAVLERLRAIVSPDTVPAVSREARTAVSYEAAVDIGLPRIFQESGPSDPRNAAFEAAVNGTGREPVADAGPASTGASLRNAQVLGLAPPSRYGTAATTWRVQNRSHSGFRITAAGADGDVLALGALVAVRSSEGGDRVLGVVRRMVKATAEKVDAGVSVIALRFAAVTLHARRQAREDMGFVVDGVDVSTIGERFDGLYLPPPSRPKQPLAEQSLVIPATEYATGRRVVVITGETVYTLVLRELMERHADWAWTLIEIIERAGRS